MPRLAPRLVQVLTNDADKSKCLPFSKPGRRKRSLHDPTRVVGRPSFNPKDYDQSILLSDPKHNPITNSRLYEMHKTLPPSVYLPKGARKGQGEKDRPREMTGQERKWWSSPYLRMLSSPIRLCAETDQYLPSDFLLRLSFLRLPQSRLPTSRPSLAIVPDGIQHSKFTVRRGGHGFHILCLREAVDQMLATRSYRRTTRDSAVVLNIRLADQIAHLLRLRVLQELEGLADRMQYHLRTPMENGNPHTIIRRLTRDEFASIKSSGTIGFENAVAVLVVPPVNRNPITKMRPQGSMSPMPPEQEMASPNKPLPPLSLLMPKPSAFQSSSKNLSLGGLLPNTAVPFYNGLTAFPSASQRAALHELLTRLLGLEQKRGHHQGFKPARESSDSPTKGKHSHAFLLCSDQENLKRGDVAAVAIALWRLRMFESGGWEDRTYSWSLGTDPDVQKLL